jgi:hypothetical protein
MKASTRCCVENVTVWTVEIVFSSVQTYSRLKRACQALIASILPTNDDMNIESFSNQQ